MEYKTDTKHSMNERAQKLWMNEFTEQIKSDEKIKFAFKLQTDGKRNQLDV